MCLSAPPPPRVCDMTMSDGGMGMGDTPAYSADCGFVSAPGGGSADTYWEMPVPQVGPRPLPIMLITTVPSIKFCSFWELRVPQVGPRPLPIMLITTVPSINFCPSWELRVPQVGPRPFPVMLITNAPLIFFLPGNYGYLKSGHGRFPLCSSLIFH
jgi:hypothetical protein